MNPQKRREIYARLQAANPNPTTELKYGTPFELLVAVVLSAQATDKSVNKATEKLFPTTPEKLVKLGVQGLEQYIKTIGLFRTKAKNVIALSKALIAEHGSAVPRTRDALQALPGVGRKTANVVMNVAYGAETFPVDTHVFRVANRTGLAPGKNEAAVEAILERQTPPPYRNSAHHLLILHGRYVCKARRPECWRCVVADLCRYTPKTPAPGTESPAPALRGKRKARP